MIIKTITCHDVYNVGASLQAFALAEYLESLGHDVEIIDYKPEYLCRHYKLFRIDNPIYNKPVVREMYQLIKLPGRIKALYSQRKAEFDRFTREKLPITLNRYSSNNELKRNPPKADVFFAGNDQIWNTFFMNGRDPAFYLDFAKKGVLASYAASFATEEIEHGWEKRVKKWISRLDYISVREQSGIKIIESLGINGAVQVLDPVFLLDVRQWIEIEKVLDIAVPYILIYDFEQNSEIGELAQKIASREGGKVYSVLKNRNCDRSFEQEGPMGFLWLIHHAEFVISNSFHATAFSLIFHKQFAVFNRSESINTRMRELLELVGIEGCLVSNIDEFNYISIDYLQVDEKLDVATQASKGFINCVLEREK